MMIKDQPEPGKRWQDQVAEILQLAGLTPQTWDNPTGEAPASFDPIMTTIPEESYVRYRVWMADGSPDYIPGPHIARLVEMVVYCQAQNARLKQDLKEQQTIYLNLLKHKDDQIIELRTALDKNNIELEIRIGNLEAWLAELEAKNAGRDARLDCQDFAIKGFYQKKRRKWYWPFGAR